VSAPRLLTTERDERFAANRICICLLERSAPNCLLPDSGVLNRARFLISASLTPKYSICITDYNTKDTIRQSLESILSEINSSFEVVVCDSCSNDGTREILEEYAKQGKLRLIVQKSTCGRGRQIAFENSHGSYILSICGMDDIFKPNLKEILKEYHAEHEGYMMGIGYALAIIPRKIVEEVGGWRDMQYFEDLDFKRRVESIKKLHWTADNSVFLMERRFARRGVIDRVRDTCLQCECRYHLGISMFELVVAYPWHKRPPILLIAICAVLICRMKRVRFLKTTWGNLM